MRRNCWLWVETMPCLSPWGAANGSDNKIVYSGGILFLLRKSVCLRTLHTVWRAVMLILHTYLWSEAGCYWQCGCIQFTLDLICPHITIAICSLVGPYLAVALLHLFIFSHSNPIYNHFKPIPLPPIYVSHYPPVLPTAWSPFLF